MVSQTVGCDTPPRASRAALTTVIKFSTNISETTESMQRFGIPVGQYDFIQAHPENVEAASEKFSR
jgi:hypothetical protein